MNTIYLLAALTLAISLLTGLYRVLKSDCDGGRMLAAQLLGTTGIGLLILLHGITDAPGLIDVALVLALLAAVAAVAFASEREGTMHSEAKDD